MPVERETGSEPCPLTGQQAVISHSKMRAPLFSSEERFISPPADMMILSFVTGLPLLSVLRGVIPRNSQTTSQLSQLWGAEGAPSSFQVFGIGNTLSLLMHVISKL